jgi:ABC-type Mn2+/Zn2+ transport system ATPase subunit
MRIASIAAQNYRTLEDVTLQFERSYCTVSGRNNAGKSSLIRLILALFGRGEGRQYYPELGSFNYGDDKTQRAVADSPILVTYSLELTESEDPRYFASSRRSQRRPFLLPRSPWR